MPTNGSNILIRFLQLSFLYHAFEAANFLSRVYDQADDGLTKNDPCQGMLNTARERGFCPERVAFDSGYSGLAHLKQINRFGWIGLTRLKANRLVNPDRRGLRPVARVPTGAEG